MMDNMTYTPASILIVEDMPDIRAWIIGILTKVFEQSRIIEAASLQQAREHLSSKDIDLMLVDINLPDGSGIELLKEVSGSKPDLYSVVITVFDDDQHLFDALKFGAKGYLLKEQGSEQLATQIKNITNGQPPLSPSIAYRILQSFVPVQNSDLTQREVQVLTMISKGLRLKDVANELDISIYTVGDHVKNMYRKLNVNNRAEATLEASRRGLLGRHT